ncbi:MAG: hypothetical protein RR555_08995 [Bacteroidales bacterium]
MKTLYYILIITIVAVIMSACKKIDGTCTPVGFTSSHVFSKDGGSIIFRGHYDTSEWVFHSLAIDEKDIPLFKEEPSIKLHYDSQIPPKIIKIEGAWFVIERINNITIKVSVSPSDIHRKLDIEIRHLNCYESIKIIQDKI